MSEAPESVVRAIQETLECRRWTDSKNFSWCGSRRHSGMTRWTDRGCSLAVRAADAAWVASLRHVRDRLPGPEAQRLLIEGEPTGWAASAIARSVRHQVTRMMADEQERGDR